MQKFKIFVRIMGFERVRELSAACESHAWAAAAQTAMALGAKNSRYTNAQIRVERV